MSFEHSFGFDLRGFLTFLGVTHGIISIWALNMFVKSYQNEHGASKSEAYNALGSPAGLFRKSKNSLTLRKARLFAIFYMLPITAILIFMGYIMGLRNE